MTLQTLDVGLKKYQKLFSSAGAVDDTDPENIQLVARLNYLIGIEWPHDALLIKKEKNFDCISISVLDESTPSVSSISVLKGHEQDEGVNLFVNFTLSEKSQLTHFEKSNKLPTIEALFINCMTSFLNSGDFKNIPNTENIDTDDYQQNFEMETESYINKLNPNIIGLSVNQKEDLKLHRCK